MRDKSTDLLKKAKDYAFLLLKFRLRSEEEIYQRLKKKKFDDRIISETVSFLKDKGFIEDNYFAKAWIESRLKRPLGLRRIKQELKAKGINKEIIDNQLAEIKKNYSESSIVTEITRQRFNRLKNIEPDKAKRRIFSYLICRGFSVDIVNDAINQIVGLA